MSKNRIVTAKIRENDGMEKSISVSV